MTFLFSDFSLFMCALRFVSPMLSESCKTQIHPVCQCAFLLKEVLFAAEQVDDFGDDGSVCEPQTDLVSLAFIDAPLL